MNKEQIKQFVEEYFESADSEFGLSREEAMSMTVINIAYAYEVGVITREELAMCGEYLDLEYDLDAIDADIAKRKEAKEKRKAARERRKARLKLEKNV